MFQKLQVENYRSLRDVEFELGQLTVIVGGNGSGKTNLYRVLKLVAAASGGEFLRTMAQEGGLPSARFAGTRAKRNIQAKKAPFRMLFGLAFDDLCYRLTLGFPSPNSLPIGGIFTDDPQVKEELVWPRAATPRSFLFKRASTMLQARDDRAQVREFPLAVAPWELGLSELREPERFPELFILRERLQAWRFYHEFPSHAGAPARQSRLGFASPVLDEDAANLAAALRTIIEIGDADALSEAVAEAMGGSLSIQRFDDGRLAVALEIQGLNRPLAAEELSDGQLRFLCLAAALLSPRPPSLMVFNEPESSLHSSLTSAVARLLARAAENSQVCVTTHDLQLVEALREVADPLVMTLHKLDGATQIETD